ncbi:sensor histidine kinase [Pseudoalteromonas sp. McH1-7]|uniref:sensor histidine kinase n=1 Tax=unclassified Pseudoalteromonas TaxID=194690 RepID=UPI001592A8C0|nr:ATP-binding protein [Pseudoalteromonas sp. SCSIO 43201]NUZ12224.1 sensor histidine kinase [Pseudoalteromonas sp. McH1-7]USD30766.1 sensor histidine kinase [Pseudoalteromonas sp. SCSIO 43201]
MSHKFSIKILIYFLLLLCGLWISYFFNVKQDEERILSQTKSNLEKLKGYVQAEFSRYQAIQSQLSQSPLVKLGLQPKSDDNDNELDRYLQDIQISSGASDIYLLDLSGTVIASSNWDKLHSYKGSNFAFRPYFYQTIKGDANVSFALGLRSKTRGFYFANPVYEDSLLLGVVVMKVNASKFESDKAQLDTGTNSHFLIADSNNIVLASNVEQWRLGTLLALSSTQRERITVARQFENEPLKPIGWRELSDNRAWSATHLGEVLVQQQVLLPQYTLYLLYEVAAIKSAQWGRLGITALILIIIFAVAEYTLSKLTGYRQLLYSQRTLEAEVAYRRQELEHAQDALIRAAKLATIGQLSASINHEINQPLSAMSAYVASAKRLALKGEVQPVVENMVLIQSLITRVHKIVAQLKSFSQHHDNKMLTTSLKHSVDNALVIVGPELKRTGVEVQCEGLACNIWVDPFKFEQVLVNIISNACQALTEQHQKRIKICAQAHESKVQLSIIDNGEGIKQHALSTIFEPFFTTKSGNGLGLGLSISKQIIESFQGQLSAHNHPQGGAEFLISLYMKNPQHD